MYGFQGEPIHDSDQPLLANLLQKKKALNLDHVQFTFKKKCELVSS